MQKCQNDKTEAVIWKMWRKYNPYASFKLVIFCRAILHLSETVPDQNFLLYLRRQNCMQNHFNKCFWMRRLEKNQTVFKIALSGKIPRVSETLIKIRESWAQAEIVCLQLFNLFFWCAFLSTHLSPKDTQFSEYKHHTNNMEFSFNEKYGSTH